MSESTRFTNNLLTDLDFLQSLDFIGNRGPWWFRYVLINFGYFLLGPLLIENLTNWRVFSESGPSAVTVSQDMGSGEMLEGVLFISDHLRRIG